MKKALAILLAALLFTGIFAAPAAAVDVESLITVNKGFTKQGADYFMNLKAANPDMTFSADINTQFTIDPDTGKMTFKTGVSTNIPSNVYVTSGGVTQVVQVATSYAWYEYFLIVLAAGHFWIALINN